MLLDEVFGQLEEVSGLNLEDWPRLLGLVGGLDVIYAQASWSTEADRTLVQVELVTVRAVVSGSWVKGLERVAARTVTSWPSRVRRVDLGTTMPGWAEHTAWQLTLEDSSSLTLVESNAEGRKSWGSLSAALEWLLRA